MFFALFLLFKSCTTSLPPFGKHTFSDIDRMHLFARMAIFLSFHWMPTWKWRPANECTLCNVASVLCIESIVQWIFCALNPLCICCSSSEAWSSYGGAGKSPGDRQMFWSLMIEGLQFFRGSRALAWTIIKCGWLCWSFLMLVCLIPPMVYYSC